MRILRPKVRLSAQSLPAHSFLMCRPTHFRVAYTINPWMDLKRQADEGRALKQWNELADRVRELGDVRLVKEREGLPDMVFTANAGTVLPGRRVVVSQFRHAERRGEEEWFAQWFGEADWFLHASPAPYEGAGDTLRFGDTLVCATGFRSEAAAHAEVAVLWGSPTLSVRLVDPYFYHLDTAFGPLDGGDYLLWPEAFDSDSLAALRGLGGRELAVPADEARRFACNSLCVGRTVIMPAGCWETARTLAEWGYRVVLVDVSEFIKAGGAVRCMVLPLD